MKLLSTHVLITIFIEQLKSFLQFFDLIFRESTSDGVVILIRLLNLLLSFFWGHSYYYLLDYLNLLDYN